MIELAQHNKRYVLRANRIETTIAELTVWQRDGKTPKEYLDTVGLMLTALRDELATVKALQAAVLAELRPRVVAQMWRDRFDRARGAYD